MTTVTSFVSFVARFHHGNMYRYELPMTTVMSLESFVDGWYKNARSKPVPAQPTAL